MSDRPLAMTMYRYEHVEALFDGRVSIAGVEPQDVPIVTDAFQKLIGGQVDIGELGLSYFSRMWDTPERPFLALPIVMNRHFRHASVFVNTAAGIERPEDLNGKRIGEFGLYGHDAGIWSKGVLSDEHGFDPATCRWVIGGTNFPIPSFAWVPQPLPQGVAIRHTEGDETLGAMLEQGELDALISVDVPRGLLTGSTAIRRLFPDYPAVERDWYRRTGIYPIAHLLTIRKELAEDEDLLRALYAAFGRARDLAVERYDTEALKDHANSMLPWFSRLYGEDRDLLGGQLWPHGMRANRRTIDTFLRYHHEQGLSRTLLTSDDIIAPALLES